MGGGGHSPRLGRAQGRAPAAAAARRGAQCGSRGAQRRAQHAAHVGPDVFRICARAQCGPCRCIVAPAAAAPAAAAAPHLLVRRRQDLSRPLARHQGDHLILRRMRKGRGERPAPACRCLGRALALATAGPSGGDKRVNSAPQAQAEVVLAPSCTRAPPSRPQGAQGWRGRPPRPPSPAARRAAAAPAPARARSSPGAHPAAPLRTAAVGAWGRAFGGRGAETEGTPRICRGCRLAMDGVSWPWEHQPERHGSDRAAMRDEMRTRCCAPPAPAAAAATLLGLWGLHGGGLRQSVQHICIDVVSVALKSAEGVRRITPGTCERPPAPSAIERALRQLAFHDGSTPAYRRVEIDLVKKRSEAA